MANWSLPTLTDLYGNILTYLKARDTDLAKGLDPAKVTVTNPVADMICWKSASARWEKYDGVSAWNPLAATYAINVATADAWSTGRTISLTGDGTGTSASWTGSGNLSFALTLASVNSNVGQFGSTAAIPIITVNAKGLVTAVGTASLGSMATQAANNVTITGGAISGTALTLAPGTAPTVEGLTQWDATNDKLVIGAGGATKTFTPDDGTATVLNKTFSTGCTWGGNTIPVNKGGTGAVTLTGLVKGNGTGAMTAAVAGTDYLAPGAIGVSVQAYAVGLKSIADLVTSADKMIYTTAANVYAVTALTAFGRSLIDDADAATARATLGVVAASEATAGLVELATTAEAAAGTDTARAVTPAGLAAGIAALASSVAMDTTGAQTITSGGALTIAHSLGVVPRFVTAWLTCTSSDQGYSVGDVLLAHIGFGSSAGNTDCGVSVLVTSANIYIRYGSDTDTFQAVHKLTGIQVSLINARWTLKVEVMA